MADAAASGDDGRRRRLSLDPRAIVGGAIVPLLMGLAADRFGLAPALLVPVACYACIAAYGLLVRAGVLAARPMDAAVPAKT